MSQTPQESVKLWRPQGFEGVEVWDIDHSKQAHPLHVLDSYHISLPKAHSHWGWVSYRRGSHELIGRCLNFYQEGEVVSYNPNKEQGSSYSVLRLSSSFIQSVLSDDALTPSFKGPLISDPCLNTAFEGVFLDAFSSFEQEATPLERETKLLGLVYALIKHCSESTLKDSCVGKEPRAVNLVREVIQAHPEQNIRLDDLACLTGLSKYHLLRVFQRGVGLSPHEYQTNLRINKAKGLLARGEKIANVALDLGFSDQAHFTRTFKQYTLTTPGHFRRLSYAAEA